MRFVKVLAPVMVVLLMVSCVSRVEKQGHAAYEKGKKTEDQYLKRNLYKKAYLFYSEAIKANPNKISPLLRNRYIEMTLVRANMVLTEGSADMDALPLYMQNLDSMLTDDVSPENRNGYAQFLSTLADSNFAKRKLYKGLSFLNKAISVASDKTLYEKKKKEILDNFSKNNYEAAEVEMINGTTNEDDESLIRAEFLAKVALLYDKDNKQTKKLLHKLYKKNRGVYSAYDGVIIDKPDTTIYRKINKYDILLAVPVYKRKGRNAYCEVAIFNYSYNPIRLRPENFMLVDVNGKRYPALKKSKMDGDILDLEHEAEKNKLFFKVGSAKIKKIIFESKDKEHYTEKMFF